MNTAKPILDKLFALAREAGQAANKLETAGLVKSREHEALVAIAVDVARTGLALSFEFGIDVTDEFRDARTV